MPLTPQLKELSPRTVTYSVFIVGLIVMAYTLIFQKMHIFAALTFLPLFLLVFRYCIQVPRFSFLLYVIFSYYLTAIMRYSRTEGLSVICDIMLVFIFLVILLHAARNKEEFRLKNIFNIVTIGYTVWMFFLLIAFLNPNAQFNTEEIIMTTRGVFLGTPILYIIASLLLDKPHLIKTALIVIGLLTLTAFLKVLYQKYRWFDAAEAEWLMNVGAGTHLLASGIRYFSIFSDAGNFGCNMGMISVIYGISAYHLTQKWMRWFCLAVMIMGVVGMLFSGTRSAIIVPLGGLALYCLLCKNIKIMIISGLSLGILYAFFAFTSIGDEYALIRRMRTAFTPTKDASFQVRLENQKKIAEILDKQPWGAGVGKSFQRIVQTSKGVRKENIPPDSYYVYIWMQTGTVGLILYLSIYAVILLRCCYIIMFRIRNKQLRHLLSALLCGIFGAWLNGYAGEGMGMPPTNTMIAASLMFIMNGPYMDKQLSEKEKITNLKK